MPAQPDIATLPAWKRIPCPECGAPAGSACGKRTGADLRWTTTLPHAARKNDGLGLRFARLLETRAQVTSFQTKAASRNGGPAGIRAAFQCGKKYIGVFIPEGYAAGRVRENCIEWRSGAGDDYPPAHIGTALRLAAAATGEFFVFGKMQTVDGRTAFLPEETYYEDGQHLLARPTSASRAAGARIAVYYEAALAETGESLALPPDPAAVQATTASVRGVRRQDTP